MAYKMPFYIRGQNRGLGCELLNAALAKTTLPGVICLGDGLRRMKFGHSHQRHSRRQGAGNTAQSLGYPAHMVVFMA